MICLAPKKRGIFQQVKFPMQDAGKLTSIAFPLHVSAGVFFHIQCRKVLSYDDLTVYSKPFLYEWTTTKGTIYVVKGVSFSPSVSVFFCQYVCLYIRVFVWFFSLGIFDCHSYLFSFLTVCFFFFSYVCLCFSFVCFFF